MDITRVRLGAILALGSFALVACGPSIVNVFVENRSAHKVRVQLERRELPLSSAIPAWTTKLVYPNSSIGRGTNVVVYDAKTDRPLTRFYADGRDMHSRAENHTLTIIYP